MVKTVADTHKCEVKEAIGEIAKTTANENLVDDVRIYGENLLIFSGVIHDSFPIQNYQIDALEAMAVIVTSEMCEGNCNSCPYGVAIKSIFDEQTLEDLPEADWQ